MTPAFAILAPTTPTQAFEFGIGACIHEKFGHSKSGKIRTTYGEAITAFRQLLQREG